MTYQWLTYDTTTGALGKHSQTQSPMIQTTTVTVGTDAPKATTTSTNTLTPSTNTTTSTDKEGVVTTTTVAIAFDSNLIHPNQAIIGPFDGVTVVMNADEQAAYNQPQAYLYQSGAFVTNSAWPAQQLAQAKSTQIATLEASMNATLSGGFTAKTLVGTATTPHTYPTDSSAQSNFTGVVSAFTTNPNKTTATILTLDAGWVSHTKAEFFGVYSDGDNWKEAQYPQLATFVAQVEAATTVADVQAVVWTAATY